MRDGLVIARLSLQLKVMVDTVVLGDAVVRHADSVRIEANNGFIYLE